MEMNTVNCACGKKGERCKCCVSCEFNPCAVTCEPCAERKTADYAYIFNTRAQEVREDKAVKFSDNGLLSGTITHDKGDDEINIERTGIYLVNYYVNSEDDNQFTLFKNCKAVDGSTYETEKGINYGQVIVAAQRGDVLTLVNSGENDVKLKAAKKEKKPHCKREKTVNASIVIIRLF